MSELVYTESELTELKRAARLFVACHEILHGVRAAIFLCPSVDEHRLWFARIEDDKLLVARVAR